MSLLETIVSKFAGSQSTAPQQQQHGLLESVSTLLSSPQIGGISGLQKLFQEQGLGNIIAGWISKGPNPPVSADQLQQVLGPDRMAQVAQKLGVEPGEAADRLSAVLPHAVDHLTPDGTIPSAGPMDAQSILSALKTKFLGV